MPGVQNPHLNSKISSLVLEQTMTGAWIDDRAKRIDALEGSQTIMTNARAPASPDWQYSNGTHSLRSVQLCDSFLKCMRIINVSKALNCNDMLANHCIAR
jgi:hypothetical protein